MKPILEIQNVTKKFRLRHEQKSYLSLRESLMGIFRKDNSTNEDFYALRNVSFNVEPGESLGIIGKNGAGKSTLLKILSKITPPSSGKIIVRGRIASLLEVGTGFHPELSGRENIYLNGSILGMKRKEIETKFDEIVDFSGTEKFLDTPLKHFSSGMQLRLAFSVAAFLEPEILVIDEVLAVGDAEFQKKCLGKMEDVSKSGRTILFVSHDLNAVQNICKKTILLADGEIKEKGESQFVIAEYLNHNHAKNYWIRKGVSKLPHFEKIETTIIGDQPYMKLRIKCTINVPEQMHPSFIAFNISSRTGIMVGQSIPELTPFIHLEKEKKDFLIEIDLNGFVPADYFLSAWIGPHFNETYDWQKEMVEFSIINSPQSNRTFPHPPANGSIVPPSRLLREEKI